MPNLRYSLNSNYRINPKRDLWRTTLILRDISENDLKTIVKNCSVFNLNNSFRFAGYIWKNIDNTISYSFTNNTVPLRIPPDINTCLYAYNKLLTCFNANNKSYIEVFETSIYFSNSVTSQNYLKWLHTISTDGQFLVAFGLNKGYVKVKTPAALIDYNDLINKLKCNNNKNIKAIRGQIFSTGGLDSNDKSIKRDDYEEECCIIIGKDNFDMERIMVAGDYFGQEVLIFEVLSEAKVFSAESNIFNSN